MKFHLKLIKKVFDFVKDHNIDTSAPYYFNDLFDRLYDLDPDQLQEYIWQLEESVELEKITETMFYVN